jgi:hypothetical protein
VDSMFDCLNTFAKASRAVVSNQHCVVVIFTDQVSDILDPNWAILKPGEIICYLCNSFVLDIWYPSY